MTDADSRHMDHALMLGRRTMGLTAENPAVGCVIVRNGFPVGLGWTARGGRPHAETQALAMAGAAARGATAYVTLEPCAHHGRTPPCAEALIAAGIARIVTAIEDPDSRVAGRGHALLRAAGIRVETGIRADEARRDLAGFLSRITRGRPHVTLKLALSADGMIAAAPGARTLITGAEANARTHLMRARADAILIGIGTALADDPELTCRLPGMDDRSPIRVVADARLALPLSSKLMRSAAAVPVWLLAARSGTLSEPGVSVIACAAGPDGRLDLDDGLRQLAARGIGRVFAEGGARLAESLLAAGLVDELMLYRSPRLLGPGGLAPRLTLGAFRQTHEEMLGEDRLSVYEASPTKQN